MINVIFGLFLISKLRYENILQQLHCIETKRTFDLIFVTYVNVSKEKTNAHVKC